MAYAAVTSLMHTISKFSNSSDIQIVENSSPEMIKLLEEEGRSLAKVLKELDNNSRRFSSKRLNALDTQITEAVFKLEDVVESHLLHQFVSQSQNYIHQQHPLVFSVDIEELKQDIDSLIETVNKIKAEYIYELSSNNLPQEEKEEEEEEEEDDDDDDDVTVRNEPRMFGILSNQIFEKIKDAMLNSATGFSAFANVYAFWGMAGIGKTTLARKLFEDPSVSCYYECHAWVTVGPEYQLEDVYLDILKQLDPSNTILEGDQEKLDGLERRLKKCFKDWKYLIVLDDVWDNKLLQIFYTDDRSPEYFKHKYHAESQVLVTTRLENLHTRLSYEWKVPFLDKKASWDLLRTKVFGDQDSPSSCTPQPERAGKKIAENCEGLPLTLIKVANILSKLERTPELWNKVAANKQHSVYSQAYAKMHKVLVPSYYCLPQYLRTSFLYMGVFPQNYEIPCNKLHMLWMAEGFIELKTDSYSVNEDHFTKLVSNSVLIVHSTATTYNTNKIVSLHSSFWYVCKKEAGKSRFFHSFTTLDDCLLQGIETQRRLCIYNPVLFAIKDAFDSMASVSAARSLLCTGAYHQYPVPISLGLSLLRVLDALPIHFYEFPMEVLKLVHLTYFALTCDGDLPDSISKLWNLVYLIVNRSLSIKSNGGAPSYLPVEIWDMKNLEHLQAMGSDLPEPPEGSHAMLFRLSKLLDVSPHSCTESILRRVPNLTKLGIRIELSPDDSVHQPLDCFDHIRDKCNLSSFKCVVVNPRIMFEVGAPPPLPLPFFPRCLKKLTLSGLGYPWEEMSNISSLPDLRVLKLLSYAFRGPKWEVHAHEFRGLEVLVIEETDLVQWTIKDDYYMNYLRRLSIKHCYDLKEMPMAGLAKSLKKIEVVDCNPLVVRSARRLNKHWSRVDLNIHSSWDDKN